MVIKGVFHIHTKYSFDSILSPKSIVKYAIKNDYDFVAIADHNTIKGAVEAYNYNIKYNDSQKLKVIIGAEYATDKGDIIGLFLKEEINSKNSKEVIKKIKEQGGITILPHPFKGHRLDDELIRNIDIIEIYDSRVNLVNNQKAKNLAKQYNKPVIIGSDAHFYRELGLTLMYYENVSSGSLREVVLCREPKIVKYEKSKWYYETLSQLIKSYKMGDARILLSQSKRFLYQLKGILSIKLKD